MSRWLITQNDAQFSVDDLAGLQKLAQEGGLTAGDMVQPPGATDWLYASEVPELQGLLQTGDDDLDDLDWKGGGNARWILGALAGLGLLGLFVAGVVTIMVLMRDLPTGEERLLGGDGLAYSEMLVTEPTANLLDDAEPGADVLASLPQDTVLELLAKRDDFYLARAENGTEGWIELGHVIPMYQLGGGEVREEYDPLYNPDRYLRVQNAGWRQMDRRDHTLTEFQFLLANGSRYDMTDVVLEAIVKDGKGVELEQVEIPIDGILPADSRTTVGMLEGQAGEEDRLLTRASFETLLEDDPDLELRWRHGIEVRMQSPEFAAAEIELLQVRAIPEE